MVKIDSIEDSPYSPLIRQFVAKEFPTKVLRIGDDALELAFAEVMGTKQVRYGPKPNIEAQAAMRAVMRIWMDRDEPIPFMVPWGSEKPDGSGVDVAELMALRTLCALNDRLKLAYKPGAVFRLRIEDASAPHLFYERADRAREEARKYTMGLMSLAHVLDIEDAVRVVPESSLVSEHDFTAVADDLLPTFDAALNEYAGGTTFLRTRANARLADVGWSGGFNEETVTHYMRSYEKLYPDRSVEWRTHMLARYFAAALARKKLGIRGDDPAWSGEFLDLSFVGPVPGTEKLFSRRVHYRTVPMEFTSNHIPPWRAKGYLRIDEQGEVSPKLASFAQLPALSEHCLQFQRDYVTVLVRSDYGLA